MINCVLRLSLKPHHHTRTLLSDLSRLARIFYIYSLRREVRLSDPFNTKIKGALSHTQGKNTTHKFQCLGSVLFKCIA